MTNLTLRPYRDESDIPAIVEIINAAQMADTRQYLATVDEVRNDYEALENCVLPDDMRLAEIDGQPVGFTRVRSWENDEGERLYGIEGHVHPTWRRQGVGRQLFDWSLNRAQQRRALDPADAKPTFVQVFTPESILGLVSLLQQNGFTPIRWGQRMRRDLSEPINITPLAEGLHIRPCTHDDVRKIWVMLDVAFRDHWGHRPARDEDLANWMKWEYFKPEMWQVAWDGDEPVGGVLNFINHDENKVFGERCGWTDPIAVLRPYRRKGVARTLLLRSLQWLKEQGLTHAMLGVDIQNPNQALHLYEGCGFKPMYRSAAYRKAI